MPFKWLKSRGGTNANRARFKDMDGLSNWPRNRLLLALPARNLKQLMPELENIRCQSEQILMDADSSLDHVFSPIAASSRWSRFMRMAASLKWQPSVGRVARGCKPSSVPRLPPSGFSSKFRGAQQRY